MTFGVHAGRVLGVARRAAIDAGVGCAGVFALLLLWWGSVYLRGAHAALPEEAVALQLQSRLRLSLFLVAVAAIVVASVGTGEDLRSGRLDRWRAGPLRPAEYVLGKWLGWAVVAAGVGGVAALMVLLLTVRNASQGVQALRPVERVHAERVAYQERDRGAWLRGDRTLLRDSSSRLVLEFPELPSAHDPQVLRYTVRAYQYERRDDQNTAQLQVLRTTQDGVEVLAECSDLGPFPIVGARLEFDASPGPVQVRIKPGAFTSTALMGRGGLAVELAEVYLEGDLGSWLAASLRVLLGMSLCLAAVLAVALALAQVLGDVVSVLCSTSLLALGMSHSFLEHAVSSSRSMHSPGGSDLGVALAERMVWLLPDFDALCGITRFVERDSGWALGDTAAQGVVLAWGGAALLAASSWVGRRR